MIYKDTCKLFNKKMLSGGREIQQALVEIGDKDPSFIGSCEWIGAIELSFVLDKLLGVSLLFIVIHDFQDIKLYKY